MNLLRVVILAALVAIVAASLDIDDLLRNIRGSKLFLLIVKQKKLSDL